MVCCATKTTLHARHVGLLQVVQPDVVLASFDAVASDISHLQPIEWEAIVVDERCMVQSNLVKAHQALREVESNFRLLLPSGNPTLVPATHASCLQFSVLAKNTLKLFHCLCWAQYLGTCSTLFGCTASHCSVFPWTTPTSQHGCPTLVHLFADVCVS